MDWLTAAGFLITMIFAILGWSLNRNISNITGSVETAANTVNQIGQDFGIFKAEMEVTMANTNRHIEKILGKMDKVEEHTISISLLKDHESRLETEVKEISTRLRAVEYAKTITS
jgi:uncharacterized protein YoxC